MAEGTNKQSQPQNTNCVAKAGICFCGKWSLQMGDWRVKLVAAASWTHMKWSCAAISESRCSLELFFQSACRKNHDFFLVFHVECFLFGKPGLEITNFVFICEDDILNKRECALGNRFCGKMLISAVALLSCVMLFTGTLSALSSELLLSNTSPFVNYGQTVFSLGVYRLLSRCLIP